MLVGSNRCWTCALGLEIWKKWKIKKEVWIRPLRPSLSQASPRPHKPPNLLDLVGLRGRLRWTRNSRRWCHGAPCSRHRLPPFFFFSPSPFFLSFFLLSFFFSLFFLLFPWVATTHCKLLLFLFYYSLLPFAIASTKKKQTRWGAPLSTFFCSCAIVAAMLPTTWWLGAMDALASPCNLALTARRPGSQELELMAMAVVALVTTIIKDDVGKIKKNKIK